METETGSKKRFRLFALGVLLYNLPVILWGAVVRATGSGAGCNDHWPLCDGKVIPLSFDYHRIIEFSHRASSGFVLVLTTILFVWALRAFPRGNVVRTGAALSLALTISEALVGAGLVLFKLVAHDESVYRAMAISVHMTNTFFLLAALTLTTWWSYGGGRLQIRGQGRTGAALFLVLLGALLAGVTGAITALGDTLFPAKSVAEIGALVSPTAHFLQHLRVYHPFVAIAVGLFAIAAAWMISGARPANSVRNCTHLVTLLVVVQISAGFMNLFLRAPIAMQMLHLFLADLLWITLVLLGAAACAIEAPLTAVAPDRIRGAVPSVQAVKDIS